MFKRNTHSPSEEVDTAKESVGSYQRRPVLQPQVPPRVHEKPSTVPFSSSTIRTSERQQTMGSAPMQLEKELPDTTLGEGVVFKGELTFKKLLKIDGQFEGELVSDGKLVVGPTGVVKSNIRMTEAIIEGKVEGNITVTNRLELRNKASVQGDIKACFLSVDEGVCIVGHVAVTQTSTLPEDL